jgi:succinoglycan biosynthesis transport protein ExoP
VPQIEKSQLMSASGPETPASPTLGERIDFVFAFLRRRYLIILICVLLCLPVGALYLFLAPPTYTGSTTLMIETRNSQILQKSPMGDLRPDPSWIESQIGILKSPSVAAYVVKQLRLAQDPEFIRSDVGPFDRLLARLGWRDPEPTSDAERASAATGAVLRGLEVKRVGQSYMMRIDFSSRSPEHAAKVAGAMIDAYIFDQLNSKYQANRRAGDWLQERLQALREQAAAAERAVVEFKAKNNIVAASGTLMNEKQLTEMSSQVAAARAHTSDVQVRLERVEAVRRAYQAEKPSSAADENVTEAMNNPIITKMRTQYLDLVNREADWSVRYGKNHLAVVNLRNQIRDARKSIHDELGRIEETLKSEYGIAKKRQGELEQGLGALIAQSTDTNQARVALFSLEASAQSYRKLYDNFLQQHTESVQQQTFPISDARLIAPASVAKTGPQSLRVWIVTTFAGVMLGVGLGAFREIMDRRFRTRDQVRAVLGTECVALFPLLPDQRTSGRQPLALPRNEESAYRTATRSIYSSAKIIRTIVNSPSSPYADAIRSIKLTVDLNSQANYAKVIGLTSCLPSEGKSTLAAATAALIAQSGARVLLMDCDLRHPALSRALAPNASGGFTDVVAGKLDLADAVWDDPTTHMAFLPAGVDTELPNATEVLASEAAKSVFSTIQIKYEYVIVDLAPLIAGVDVRATSGLIDSYVLVIEWGATKVDAVQYALRNAPNVQENIVCAVLNKVNIAAMSRYDSHGAKDYYGRPRYENSVH